MNPNVVPLPQLTVSMSNSLIRQSQDLSLNEKRIVSCFAAKIYASGYNDNEGVCISGAEYAELFDLDLSNAYHFLKSAANKLYERSIEATLPDGKESTRWIYRKGIYKAGSGFVRLHISPSIIPELQALTSNFTRYRLEQVSTIKCKFTYRLFELLCSWRYHGQFAISNDELRDFLSVKPSYSPNKFLSRVITPSIPMIESALNVELLVEQGKTGRAVSSWRFTFITPKK